tara:strand:- start:1066 stop:1227 length:162 start_codon:yes stop_codon:yes gene_type:complete
MKLFRRKTKKEKLLKQYKEILVKSHKMSSINRAKADELVCEAEQIMKQIEAEN